jgi:hypothetical protein
MDYLFIWLVSDQYIQKMHANVQSVEFKINEVMILVNMVSMIEYSLHTGLLDSYIL